MTTTYLHQARSVETQTVATFTGEGAYHGSTKARRTEEGVAAPAPPRPAPVPEMTPTTLDAYEDGQAIGPLEATFPNLYEVVERLAEPSQEAIRDDGVTFCWCPLDVALREAGPVTREVLEAMQRHVTGTKRFVYIDSKIQYFEAGDVPVDSQHWHVDGSIVARGQRVLDLGHNLLHDMRARIESDVAPPTYLSYQSSDHCATLFVTEPLTVTIPELIPNFDGLDASVRALEPAHVAQPAATVARFDGLSLHRAVAAHGAGWRLWVRCIETDREVRLTRSIITCYGTVFRTTEGQRVTG